MNLLVAEDGTVLGLVGENGAGKTTLLRLLLNLIRPSAGRVTLARGVRVGYVPERPAAWMTLTVREHLTAVGRCSGLRGKSLASAIDRVLHLVELTDKVNARANTLSRGMLQRLGLAQAVLYDPELLVLDEPASGLDPGGQRTIRELIQKLHAEGRTILLSSHYLVEMERVCTAIAVVHRGQIVLEKPLRDILLQHRHRVRLDLDHKPESLEKELAALGLEFRIEAGGVVFENLTDEQYFRVMSLLTSHRIRVLSMGYPGLLLEQVFLDASEVDGV